MFSYNYLVYLFLFVGMTGSIIAKKLTVPAALLGGLTGFWVFTGGGYVSLLMLCLFFILGSAATGFKLNKKQQIGSAERDKGRRTVGQVMANGSVAALLG